MKTIIALYGAFSGKLYHYKKYSNELDIDDLQFPPKFSDTPKIDNLNSSISVNVLVYENNEVFPLYASKLRDRKHHINVLMISNSEGKFHYLPSATCPLWLMAGVGRTKHDEYTHVFLYSLYCFSKARLLTAHIPDCSIHPEKKMEYSSPYDPGKM